MRSKAIKTLNCQPSTVNRQPSTVNRQLSTINHQLKKDDSPGKKIALSISYLPSTKAAKGQCKE